MVADAKPGGAAEKPGFPLTQVEIDSFAARSAPLGAILRGDEATRIVEAYKREDLRALDWQSRFLTVAGRLNRTVLTTAVIGAVILALGVLKPLWVHDDIGTRSGQDIAGPQFDQLFTWIVAALGFLGILVGGYAAALLYELNAGDLEGDWMQSRARAEKLRSEYFDRLVARAAKSEFRNSDRCIRPRQDQPAPKPTRLLCGPWQASRSRRSILAAQGRLRDRSRRSWRRGGRHGGRRRRALAARHRGAWRDRHGRRVFRHIAGDDRSGAGTGAALPQQCRRAGAGGAPGGRRSATPLATGARMHWSRSLRPSISSCRSSLAASSRAAKASARQSPN